MGQITSSSALATVPKAPAAGPSAKWLWGAIGTLAVCVVALGGALVGQQRGASPTVEAPTAVQMLAADPAGVRTQEPQAIKERAPAAQPAGPRGAQANGSTSSHAPAVVQPGGARQMVAQQAPLCMTCGRVESVQAVQQAAPATGVGAVAGGVIGGLLGNQVGKGSGRALATVAGVVGGGYVGHTVEQRTRSSTAYQMSVRMDDGSVRTFTRSQPVAEGTPMRVEGNTFRVDSSADNRSAPSAQSVRVADTGS